ncbi:MAG: hypothetical protein AAF493_19015, partial [Pseudomonadota bacterium]
VNQALSGGRLLLPVRELVGMHSRPSGEREPWFPCRQGDWVSLDDGRLGRVVVQTPDTVQLVELGGARLNFTTRNFLDANPRNLSHNFRVEVRFGIDYAHQSIATTEVPDAMKRSIHEGLLEILEPDELLNVEVDFLEAAASSLDYEVEADVAGRAAAKHEDVERAMVRILVDTCNDRGWVIPFQQITLHHAPSVSDAP